MSAKYKKSMFELLSQSLANFKHQIGVDPITQLPTLSVDSKTKIEDNSIDAIFDTISKINEKQKVAVFIDEFQDILKIKEYRAILAKLRGKIQYLSDVSFIYAGSVRHQMEQIFADIDSSFFKSAIPITIGPIKGDLFSNFIKARFKTGKRAISDEIIEKIFSIANMVTGDIQQLCEAVWSTSSYGDEINNDCLCRAIELIFSHENIVYQRIFGELTNFQLRVLKSIAQHGGIAIYSNRFFEKSGFTNASSVKTGVNKLLKAKILFNYKNEYKFANPFFKLWLIKNYI
jgi:hypothetical protein